MIPFAPIIADRHRGYVWSGGAWLAVYDAARFPLNSALLACDPEHALSVRPFMILFAHACLPIFLNALFSTAVPFSMRQRANSSTVISVPSLCIFSRPMNSSTSIAC